MCPIELVDILHRSSRNRVTVHRMVATWYIQMILLQCCTTQHLQFLKIYTLQWMVSKNFPFWLGLPKPECRHQHKVFPLRWSYLIYDTLDRPHWITWRIKHWDTICIPCQIYIAWVCQQWDSLIQSTITDILDTMRIVFSVIVCLLGYGSQTDF